MKISLNVLKQYLNFDLPDIQTVIDKIGSQLGAVDEAVINLGPIYSGVVVAKVVDCQELGGSDHLKLCLIDDGQKIKDISRSDNGLIQVVCGAPNVANGQLVAWLPPGSVVPSTYNNQPYKITVRQIMDKTSNGMLASPKELGIGETHEGLLIIDVEAKPGDSFADIYQLDDHIIDIENKMFTHRPDCFGLIGVARELSGIFDQAFKSPDWYKDQAEPAIETDKLPLSVVNEIPELVPRFCAVVVDRVVVQPSPIKVQSMLSRMGIRPINNVVDATNLSMLLSGQPLHAYDYNKLKALSGAQAEITIRQPHHGESIKLLNSKIVKPSAESIIIAAGQQSIGLAGIMGSAAAEVDASTTAVVLESANFDMFSIRRSSMELGVFSDAVTRFSKAQSPLQNKRVLISCIDQLKQLSAPGEALVASDVIDINNLPQATNERGSVHPPISISVDYINSRLGSQLSAPQMAKLLSNVECQVELSGENLTIKAPFWRTDLEIREDIVEEVGRLYGYDNLKPQALNRRVEPVAKNSALETKNQLRQLLARAGANELLNYSFVSRKLLENANQDAETAFEIANSLSPELNFYRLSLSPSLLGKVHTNIKAGFDDFGLFEIGTYHLVGQFDEHQDDLPKEYQSLALVYASKNPRPGAAYYKARNYFSFLIDQFKLTGVAYQPLKKAKNIDPAFAQLVKPFEPSRSALITDSKGNTLGVVGEYSRNVRASFKLPAYCAGLEVDSQLFNHLASAPSYARLSRYPSLKQDITLKAPAELNYVDLEVVLNTKLSELINESSFASLELLGIFQAPSDTAHKNFSFRLKIGDHNRTLEDNSVNQLLDSLAETASKLGVTRV